MCYFHILVLLYYFFWMDKAYSQPLQKNHNLGGTKASSVNKYPLFAISSAVHPVLDKSAQAPTA